MEVLRHSDPEGCARRAAALMADPEIVHLGLAGGSTPQRAYELLGGLRSSWEGVHLWFGDERCVAPDDDEANWAMATKALDAPGAVWHRIRGELGPDEAAAAYADELGDVTLDLVLLGLGEDGHTASLFPGNPALDSDLRVIGVRGAPKPPGERVSLGLDVLNTAGRIVLLVAGAGKREALARVLAGPHPDVPASLLDRGRLTVVADAEALGDGEPAGDDAA